MFLPILFFSVPLFFFFFFMFGPFVHSFLKTFLFLVFNEEGLLLICFAVYFFAFFTLDFSSNESIVKSNSDISVDHIKENFFLRYKFFLTLFFFKRLADFRNFHYNTSLIFTSYYKTLFGVILNSFNSNVSVAENLFISKSNSVNDLISNFHSKVF